MARGGQKKLSIFDFQKDKKAISPRINVVDGGDKHQNMLEAMAPFAKVRIQKNLTPVEIVTATKKTKVLNILMPEWNTYFPPFNVARLTALAKRTGYETNALDLNVKAHNFFHAQDPKPLDYDPWDPARFIIWQNEYHLKLHHIFKDFFLEYVDKIVESAPDVIGFSTYYCNFHPVKFLAEKIRERLPNVRFMIGGPYMQTSSKVVPTLTSSIDGKRLFDFGVIGEGEILYLKILAEVEAGMYFDETRIYSQPEDQRINLNNMPIPDYSDLDFDDYRFPNGILSEFSRGCVAKCTFCDETHFWLYRQRNATDAISEIETLYNSKGTDVVWFIDSLVNGNLKELRGFCKGVQAKGLDIHWTGYARCDGRMDLEYFTDLRDGGCTVLNYGCESASNKVLSDMDKRVTREEMEQNFTDSHKVGIGIMTNWVLSFPTEDQNDFADSATFCYRVKDKSVMTYSWTTGFNLGPISIAGQNFEKFNVSHTGYLGHWMTLDHSFGKPHVLVRSKCFSILIENMKLPTHAAYIKRDELKLEHYSIEFDEDITNYIGYEKFDYDIIKSGKTPWENNLVNQIFSLFRLLWRIRGGFKMSIIFDPEKDAHSFGSHQAGELTAKYDFIIDKQGNWKAELYTEFNQPQYDQPNGVYPFYQHDYNDFDSSGALRARKLAKSEHGMESMPIELKHKQQGAAQALNENADWSFIHEESLTGKWEIPEVDNAKYEIVEPVEISPLSQEVVEVNKDFQHSLI